ncbi:MAG: hypothetical protein J6N93_00130, partial [Clostridia bacterium]|nr:hypothetical protein [Clostridia bacterium]
GIDEYFYRYYTRNKTAEEISRFPLYGGFGSNAYTVENINDIIAKATELGYLVVYNHPVWSRVSPNMFLGIKGLTGMEIYNHGGYLGGYEEDVGIIYDFMLRDGQKIYCFANDDNHNLQSPDDSFGGYNMIYAEKLDYDSVFKAIKNGDFYASTGAEIKYIAYKDGKIYVGTENAKYIRLTTNGRYSGFVTAENKPLTEAVFDVANEYITYFRITVKTIDGAKAYSRAYFKTPDGSWE